MSLSARAQKLMSDEERARIVRQATEDTEKFLASLPRKGYKDGWPEDKWEEEMEKHPLFVSEISENAEVSPLVAAFQSLKYDPEYNDPTELAKAHKVDGNEQFKLKKYRYAVTAYSEGIRMRSDDTELNVILFTNRAAAFYHLGNYRKSLEDATVAKVLKPHHTKAIHRGALCCLEMRKYDDCISWCEEGLEVNNGDETLLDLKQKAEEHIKKQEMLKLEAEAEQVLLDELTKAIKERGINIIDNGLTPESIVCDYPGSSAKVHMTEQGELVWPVVFMYPQYGISDFIPKFNENSCFYDYFCELFSDHPDWDIKQEYIPDTLKIYFCVKNGDIIPIDMKKSLKSALCHKRFQVISGTLNFFVTCPEFDEFYRSQNYVVKT